MQWLRDLRIAVGLTMLGGIGLLTVPRPSSAWAELWYNPSESAPRGWYLQQRAVKHYELHQWVLVRLPSTLAQWTADRGYLPAGLPLLKQVAATPGDTVCEQGGAVRINGQRLGVALDVDGRRRVLQAWVGCRPLRPDEYFLWGPNSPASFDSRYFGPVRVTDITGSVVPVWIS
jgi:conjugative transfer signal peptidase TraF